MAIIDDSALARFTPHEAQIMLEKLGEIYGSGISAREAVELHRLEKVLKAKAASTYEPDA
jgi:hypothetical protein